MATVTICKGLPASGKSTWAKEQVARRPGEVKRVNKDDLRAMLDGGHWTKDNEKFVENLRDHIILSALSDGKHVPHDCLAEASARFRQAVQIRRTRVTPKAGKVPGERGGRSFGPTTGPERVPPPNCNVQLRGEVKLREPS